MSLLSSHLKLLLSSHLSVYHRWPNPPSHLKLKLSSETHAQALISQAHSLKLSPLGLPLPADPPSHLKLKLSSSSSQAYTVPSRPSLSTPISQLPPKLNPLAVPAADRLKPTSSQPPISLRLTPSQPPISLKMPQTHAIPADPL